MKKISWIILTVALFVSGSCAAISTSLPDNYDLAALTIDAAWIPLSSFSIGSGNSSSTDNNNFLAGVTVGVGNGFACQVRANTLNVSSYTAKNGNNLAVKGALGELNLMYQIDRYAAVYVGATYTEGTVYDNTAGATSSMATFGGQIGGVVDVPVYRDLSGFLNYSIGNQLSQFSIGAEYTFTGFGSICAGYYILQQYSIQYQGNSDGYTMNGPLLGLSFSI